MGLQVLFDRSPELIAALPDATDDALLTMAYAYANAVKEQLAGGFTSGAFVTGALANSVTVQDPEDAGSGERAISVGTDVPYGLYWEVGRWRPSASVGGRHYRPPQFVHTEVRTGRDLGADAGRYGCGTWRDLQRDPDGRYRRGRSMTGTLEGGQYAPPMAGIVCGASATPAFDAVSASALVDPGVGSAERMPVHAVRLSIFLARRTVAATTVHAVLDRLQVRRVTARTVPAQMVNLQSGADRPDKVLIRESMTFRRPPVKRRSAVTGRRADMAGIYPTFVAAASHISEEPFQHRLAAWWHYGNITCGRAA